MSRDLVELLVLVVRAGLAAVLVAAGAAKLADTQSFAATLLGLGVPAQQGHVARKLSIAVPIVEVGLGLVSASGLWRPAVDVAILLLFMGFSVVVAVALRRAPEVTCRCFGALSDSQFSVKGLMRSLLLTAAAIVVWWGGRGYDAQLVAAPGMVLLLVAGYALFAVAAAQAAKTLAQIKARMAS